MKDKLKEFIQKNKAQFEDDMPSADLWDRIDGTLRPEVEPVVEEPSRASNRWNWGIAASFLLLLASGLTLYIFNFNDSETDIIAEEQVDDVLGTELSLISDDLAEVDSYYTVQVSEKMNDLKHYEVDEELMEEVQLLKEEFDELKKEMGLGADQALIVEAMINNYRLRLALLEDLLEAVSDEENETKIKSKKDV